MPDSNVPLFIRFGPVVAILLLTLTTTLVLVATFPEESLLTALSILLPLVVLAVFHDTEYGEVVSSAPTCTPSTKNLTPLTATLSVEEAVMFTTPETVLDAVGDVRETRGAVVSGVEVELLTITVMVDVELFPLGS